jgi:hypothetical protein
MNSKKGSLLALALALVAVLVATPRAKAESELDFTIVNSTGYGIKELYVGPTKSDSWGENLLDETLENGESVKIEFHPEAEDIAKWDIMIAWVDEGENVYWRGYKLAEISKITLKYNRKTGETTAVTE